MQGFRLDAALMDPDSCRVDSAYNASGLLFWLWPFSYELYVSCSSYLSCVSHFSLTMFSITCSFPAGSIFSFTISFLTRVRCCGVRSQWVITYHTSWWHHARHHGDTTHHIHITHASYTHIMVGLPLPDSGTEVAHILTWSSSLLLVPILSYHFQQQC